MTALGEGEEGIGSLSYQADVLLCQAVGHRERGEFAIWDQTQIRANSASVEGGTECSQTREGSSQLPDGEDFIERGAFQWGFEGCIGVGQERSGEGTGNSVSRCL